MAFWSFWIVWVLLESLGGAFLQEEGMVAKYSLQPGDGPQPLYNSTIFTFCNLYFLIPCHCWGALSATAHGVCGTCRSLLNCTFSWAPTLPAGPRGSWEPPKLAPGIETCAISHLMKWASDSSFPHPMGRAGWCYQLQDQTLPGEAERQESVQFHALACVATSFRIGKWQKAAEVKPGSEAGAQLVRGAAQGT